MICYTLTIWLIRIKHFDRIARTSCEIHIFLIIDIDCRLRISRFFNHNISINRTDTQSVIRYVEWSFFISTFLCAQMLFSLKQKKFDKFLIAWEFEFHFKFFLYFLASFSSRSKYLRIAIKWANQFYSFVFWGLIEVNLVVVVFFLFTFENFLVSTWKWENFNIQYLFVKSPDNQSTWFLSTSGFAHYAHFV